MKRKNYPYTRHNEILGRFWDIFKPFIDGGDKKVPLPEASTNN
jgi:hypothetical protein